MARPKKEIQTDQLDQPQIDTVKINALLNQVGYFDKDSSGPLGIEERLRIASYNMHVFKEIIKELIKE